MTFRQTLNTIACCLFHLSEKGSYESNISLGKVLAYRPEVVDHGMGGVHMRTRKLGRREIPRRQTRYIAIELSRIKRCPQRPKIGTGYSRCQYFSWTGYRSGIVFGCCNLVVTNGSAGYRKSNATFLCPVLIHTHKFEVDRSRHIENQSAIKKNI